MKCVGAESEYIQPKKERSQRQLFQTPYTSVKHIILRVRFNKISPLRMVLKHLKLHQTAPISQWYGTKFFSTHVVEKLHHFTKILQKWCSITQTGNTVRQQECGKPEQSDQIVHGVFFQAFTKSCQIINKILQIILPKYGHTIYRTTDPILIV